VSYLKFTSIEIRALPYDPPNIWARITGLKV